MTNQKNYYLEFERKKWENTPMVEQGASKFDQHKPKFNTVPQKALMEIMEVFTYGANKYGQFNYSGKMEGSRYINAAIRHIMAYNTGEDIDEIGTHHLANAAASLMMALDGIKIGSVIDDRNKAYNEENK
jgi:hypothetical protein